MSLINDLKGQMIIQECKPPTDEEIARNGEELIDQCFAHTISRFDEHPSLPSGDYLPLLLSLKKEVQDILKKTQSFIIMDFEPEYEKPYTQGLNDHEQCSIVKADEVNNLLAALRKLEDEEENGTK